MPTLWYVDPTYGGGPTSFIGQYGTGTKVGSWSAVTKAADSWYFGLGGTTAPAGAFWNNTWDGVRIGSYGDGKHYMDFSAATMPGSGSIYCIRSRNPDFTLENLHIIGHLNYNHQVMISDNGAAGLKVRNVSIEGPGYRGISSAPFGGAWSCFNLSPATAGDYEIADLEVWGTNAGITVGGAVPPNRGLFTGIYVHDLAFDDPGNSDCITIGGGSTVIDFAYKLQFIGLRLTGFGDQAFDTVGGRSVHVEDFDIWNDNRATGNIACGGMILGGLSAGGAANPVAAGANRVMRGRIRLVTPTGYANTVIGINTRYGSGNLVAGVTIQCPNTAIRDEWDVTKWNQNSAPNPVDTDKQAEADATGRDNVFTQCTAITTGTTVNDTPVHNVSGINLQLNNCALIGSGSSGGAIRTSNTRAGNSVVYAGCKTNLGNFQYGAGSTTPSGSNNQTGRTMPTGPDYFPTAHLLGTGDAIARRWMDWYGVPLPDNLVGGMAPDARTSAAPGVTRRWWKGWAKPTAALA